MSRPLLYSSNGAVVPGSILTAATDDGAVGRWTAPQTIELLDPTSAQLSDVVSAYNNLVWGLAQSRLLKTEPRVWFEQLTSHSDMGLKITVTKNGVAHERIIIPGANTTMKISDFVAIFNGFFEISTGVKMLFTGTQVMIVVPENVMLVFEEISTLQLGSGRHIINRIFNGAASQYMGTIHIGPSILQGLPITQPIVHYQTPAPSVSNPVVKSRTTSSIKIGWDWPFANRENMEFYVKVTNRADSSVSILKTTDLEIDITGLDTNTAYDIVVITASEYQTSKDDSTIRAIPTLFGPVVDSKTKETDILIYNAESLYSPSMPSLYGYKVPANSPMIGYRFNKVIFPKINMPAYPTSIGTVSSYDAWPAGRKAELKIKVYSNNPYTGGGVLLAESPILQIESNKTGDLTQRYPNEYSVVLPSTVTLAENVHILFIAESDPSNPPSDVDIRFNAFTNTGYSLVTVRNVSATNKTTIIETPESPLCNFELV